MFVLETEKHCICRLQEQFTLFSYCVEKQDLAASFTVEGVDSTAPPHCHIHYIKNTDEAGSIKGGARFEEKVDNSVKHSRIAIKVGSKLRIQCRYPGKDSIKNLAHACYSG